MEMFILYNHQIRNHHVILTNDLDILDSYSDLSLIVQGTHL